MGLSTRTGVQVADTWVEWEPAVTREVSEVAAHPMVRYTDGSVRSLPAVTAPTARAAVQRANEELEVLRHLREFVLGPGMR